MYIYISVILGPSGQSIKEMEKQNTIEGRGFCPLRALIKLKKKAIFSTHEALMVKGWLIRRDEKGGGGGGGGGVL